MVPSRTIVGMERTSRITARCAGRETPASTVRSGAAEMPEVDHRISQGLECVVQLAEAIEAKQQAPEFVLPAEDPLDGAEPFFEDRWIEQRLAAGFRCFASTRVRVDVGDHAAIEDGFAVGPAIVDPLQADDGALQGEAELTGDTRHLRRCFAHQGPFVALSGR